jgi:hypothetical protein
VRDATEARRLREAEEARAYEVAEQALELAEMSDETKQSLADIEENIRERGFMAGSENLDVDIEGDFQAFQAGSRAEMQRLMLLMSQCLEKYTVMGLRWEFLLKLPDVGPGLRQAVPLKVLECREADRPRVSQEYLNQLYTDADMVHMAFFKEMERCVMQANAATWPKELGLDEEKWPFQMRRRRNQKATLLPCCWLRLGPTKDRIRSECKIAQDYDTCAWPQSAHLLDIIRCAVAFDDPYALVAFAEFLGTQMQVGRIKNKFKGFVPGKLALPGSTPESEYRDLLLNVVFRARGVSHVVEVQLALRDLATLKTWSHRHYKVDRMLNYQDLLYQNIFSSKDGQQK